MTRRPRRDRRGAYSSVVRCCARCARARASDRRWRHRSSTHACGMRAGRHRPSRRARPPTSTMTTKCSLEWTLPRRRRSRCQLRPPCRPRPTRCARGTAPATTSTGAPPNLPGGRTICSPVALPLSCKQRGTRTTAAGPNTAEICLSVEQGTETLRLRCRPKRLCTSSCSWYFLLDRSSLSGRTRGSTVR